MKILATIFGFLGAAGALFLGFKWISDLNSELGQAAQALAGANAELSGMKTAAWVLILCAVVGIVAIVMMFKQGTGKGLPAILLLVAGILPIVFSSKAMFGTPMVLGAVFAFMTKPNEAAATQAPAAPE